MGSWWPVHLEPLTALPNGLLAWKLARTKSRDKGNLGKYWEVRHMWYHDKVSWEPTWKLGRTKIGNKGNAGHTNGDGMRMRTRSALSDFSVEKPVNGWLRVCIGGVMRWSPSYLFNGNSFTRETKSLHWIGFQRVISLLLKKFPQSNLSTYWNLIKRLNEMHFCKKSSLI